MSTPCFASGVDPEGNPWCRLVHDHDEACRTGESDRVTDLLRKLDSLAEQYDELLSACRDADLRAIRAEARECRLCCGDAPLGKSEHANREKLSRLGIPTAGGSNTETRRDVVETSGANDGE